MNLLQLRYQQSLCPCHGKKPVLWEIHIVVVAGGCDECRGPGNPRESVSHLARMHCQVSRLKPIQIVIQITSAVEKITFKIL